MSWAARRRFIILLIVGAVVVAFASIIGISIFYKTPSCSDGVQNQGETGVDCGGPCPYLCTYQQQPPTVLFTQVLSNGAGRTDVVAMIQNKNVADGAKDVPYSIALYDAGHVLVQEIGGTLDLPPGATEPVYVPGVASGKRTVASAFLDIASSSPQWVSMIGDPRIVPAVSNIMQSGIAAAPRIEATLTNPSALALSDVQAIVFVYDAQKDVIAASETLVPAIAAQGQATAIFTWNAAFDGAPASIQVVPIIPLP